MFSLVNRRLSQSLITVTTSGLLHTWNCGEVQTDFFLYSSQATEVLQNLTWL